jgi:enoyl-CoA hydratase/carnithine racemase
MLDWQNTGLFFLFRYPCVRPGNNCKTGFDMSPEASTQQIAVTDIPNRSGGIIRLIELNRPEKLNCLSLQMLKSLLAALQDGEKSDCIVLTGAGRAFCTGLDFNEIGGPENATVRSVSEHLQLIVQIYRWFLTARIPTIALARGYAAGGGAAFAASAQTTIVSEDFRCKLPGGNLARFATVAIPLFNRRANERPRNDAGWLGREWDATEAKRLGLVDQIVTSEQLENIIRSVKGGELPPEYFGNPKRCDYPVKNTLEELEGFLKNARV